MPVMISLLRGVNVGGHHMIKMDALRDLYASLQLKDAKTHVQSGNVVFRTRKHATPALAAQIEQAIEREFGFRPSVILRTSDDLRGIVACNPFGNRRNIEHSKLLVSFLASEPTREARNKVLGIKADPEELKVVGRELYIYFPNGMGRPKLSMAAVERCLQVPATGRNWNTVLKLLEMAEEMEREG
jgi:uncharacterized protein (DUF1697 family)